MGSLCYYIVKHEFSGGLCSRFNIAFFCCQDKQPALLQA